MTKNNFARIPPILPLPELLEMQKKSIKDFLQADLSTDKRKIQGLQATLLDVFPISNADDTLELQCMGYEIGEPKYSMDEALVKDATYAAPIKAHIRLIEKKEGGKVKQIAEQDVFICDLPIMTDTATFIINGAERVVVSQLHRSPGIIFEEDEEKNISSYGKKLYYARIIPYRGAWVEFEYDLNNAVYVRIDKKRKVPATTLLRAIGIVSDAEILRLFHEVERVHVEGARVEGLVGRITASDVVDKSTGEVLAEANRELTRDLLAKIQEKKIKEVEVLKLDPALNDVSIRNTLAKDPHKTKKEATQALYRILRAQEYIAPDQAESYLDNLLFKSVRKYDFTRVGRYKVLRKFQPLLEQLASRKDLNFEVPTDRKRTLTLEDIIVTLQYLIALNNGLTRMTVGKTDLKIEIDDIDHLGNRRVRVVGELLENQFRIGLMQMARLARDKMNLQDKALLTPRTILNTSPVVGIVRKFFGTSQLSQFMDQTNPLAELTHKRRLSALGPGGLHRKRAGFEVRDVHHTHYGRLCPIETPEGPNIGLITSLACFARVNEYGLIESPYRRVENGKVTDEVEYLTANKEDEYVVAQANAPLDKSGRFAADLIACRHRGDFPLKDPKDIDYMDISPMQVVSVSTAMIPFLEHDDANRALMGSNMQRQAVPLMESEMPIVATGIEDRVARDSAATVTAHRPGKVVSVTSDQISVWCDEDSKNPIDSYSLRKYMRSNQDTSVNFKPVVMVGDKVKKSDVLADGPCTDQGQIALGKNILVAFMPWEGYNFEDAILVSERLVQDDVFTSNHIQEFKIEARDTKMGAEEITRDIPNVGADALTQLDENGIIRLGAEVVPGDILVGKVTPKGEQQVSPEEKLLKVIFGKKAEEVSDASLVVPPGVTGKVLSVEVFIRREKLGRKEDEARKSELEKAFASDLDSLRREKKDAIAHCDDQAKKKELSGREVSDKKKEILALFEKREQMLRKRFAREKEGLKSGDEMPVTVNKIVKVYIVSRRKIQIGDKLAGRHGNKGVVAKVLGKEDMPYLPDGTPIDMVLSPLGVPSRMNVGQILETMLGWAGHVLGIQMVTPVFDGAKEDQVIAKVREAKQFLMKKGVPEKFVPDDYCRIQLYDGRTGEPFAEKVTVGIMYMLKLSHLVEDKIHARSTGPYSLITRQPLGGKAQFGGQRFGEMEVWAIEGYGAAYTLQEFLTVKSDDVASRTKMYESIIKGETMTEPGVPESFKVLIKELQSLGLSIELLKKSAVPDEGEKSRPESKSKEKVEAN
ncbi:MAG: DNA-directed RNA polymerase subunit beta [Elusimicrobia bacterium RIFCSPLOWO2_01_FULL_64_13]|nr:MAG: DNA-directed RNA polymerase subunit beta [Elusimicrobia bacterium RIFCSPLOWO2_01_FULL_64_13]